MGVWSCRETEAPPLNLYGDTPKDRIVRGFNLNHIWTSRLTSKPLVWRRGFRVPPWPSSIQTGALEDTSVSFMMLSMETRLTSFTRRRSWNPGGLLMICYVRWCLSHRTVPTFIPMERGDHKKFPLIAKLGLSIMNSLSLSLPHCSLFPCVCHWGDDGL